MGCPPPGSGLDGFHTGIRIGRCARTIARWSKLPDLLLAALERANDAVVIVDSDLHVSHFNAAAETHLGTGSRRSARSSCQPSRTEGTAAACCDASLRSGERRRRTRRTLRDHDPAQGRQPDPCRAVAFARRGRRSKPHHRLRSGHHRRGRATRERLALLTLVADRTNRAVVVTDHNLKVVYTNAAFARMFGYSCEEATGPAGERTAGGPAYRSQDAGKVATLDRRGERRRGGNPRLRQERRRNLDLGQRQGVPQRARAGQVHVRAADRYHRDQAVAVAAAADHECAGR